MKVQKAYKLGERLNEFIIQLGAYGFSYEEGFCQIRSEKKNVTAGRILNISPYYLIIHLPHPESEVQREVISKLTELAESFK